MALTIQAPQTNTGDLRALYNYQYALNELLNSDPIQKGLFGDNAIFGKNGYLNTLSNNMIASNNLQAQDYFKNLSLDEITRAKNEGRDLLKEYSNGRYFFNPEDEKVRTARDTRDLAEKTYIQGKIKDLATARANNNQLKGSDTQLLMDMLGISNRTLEEQNQYKQDIQDTWLKRNSPEIFRRVADLGLDDPTGEKQRQYLEQILRENDIDSKNASDYLNPDELDPYIKREADRRIVDALNQNSDINNVQQIADLNNFVRRYAMYADPANVANFERYITDNEGRLLDRMYTDIETELRSTPEWVNIEAAYTPDEIREQFILPKLQERTGYSTAKLLQYITGNNQIRSAYEQSGHWTINEDAALAQAKIKEENALKEADKNYGFGSALFNGGKLSVPESVLKDSSLFDKDNKEQADVMLSQPFNNSTLNAHIRQLTELSHEDVLTIKTTALEVLSAQKGRNKFELLKDLRTNPTLQSDYDDIIKSGLRLAVAREGSSKAEKTRQSALLKRNGINLGGQAR